MKPFVFHCQLFLALILAVALAKQILINSSGNKILPKVLVRRTNRVYIIKCCGKSKCFGPAFRKNISVSISNAAPRVTNAQAPCQKAECPQASATLSAESKKAAPSLVIIACSKRYEIFSNALSVSEALNKCSKQNAELLSLKTLEENSCLVKMGSHAAKIGREFWTSGSNAGEGCQQVFSWCPGGEPITLHNEDAFWGPSGQPSTFPSDERCLAFAFSGGIKLKNCNFKLPFICQSLAPAIECPSSSCEKNLTLFTGVELTKPSQHGSWMTLCSQSYLFGNKPVTWEENWRICCSLGMQPIYLASQTQQECFTKYTKDNKWRLNHNFWTGGTQWSWCKPPESIDPDIEWDTNEPDNKDGIEKCVHLKIGRNGSGVRLTDKNCASKFIFACQGVYATEQKPIWEICAKKDEYLHSNGSVKQFHDFGKWFKSKSNQYLLVKHFNTSWKDAWNYCCQLDMRLISVSSFAKARFFSNWTKTYKRDFNGDFWTSGMRDSKDVFQWAAKEKEFSATDTKWKSGEPSRKGNCVYLETRNSVENTVLATDDCVANKKFICELKKDEGQGLLIQMECAELWNITDGEIDSLLNPSATLTRNLKCFIKCVGEDMDLFANNGLVPLVILRKIEDMYENDMAKMSTAFDNFDACSSKVLEDECATAAQIYQCGLQKDPTFTNDLIVQSKGSSIPTAAPVEMTNVPRYRNCEMSDTLPCIRNETLIAELQATNSTPIGSLKLAGAKLRFMSNYQLPFFSREQAYKYCCSLGMILPVENDPNERIAVQTTLKLNLPPDVSSNDNLTEYFSGDTFSEIEDGYPVDYYCHNGQFMSTNGFVMGVRNTPTCMIVQSQEDVAATYTVTLGDDYCSTVAFSPHVVCEYP